MALEMCDMLWIKNLLQDLKVKEEGTMELYCDDRSAINIADNPVQNDRTKHIEVERYFIKKKLENGLICMKYVQSQKRCTDVHAICTISKKVGDILPKGLNYSTFRTIMSKLGMSNIYSPARGGVLEEMLKCYN